MAHSEAPARENGVADPLFVTTRWSVVLAAKDKGSPECGRALETLCRQYWYPLYAFVRGLGYSPHDAQDLTQEFFSRLLAREYLRVVEPEKGRFRTFLRMALRRFLASEWERSSAQKRGGGITFLPFDSLEAEERLDTEAHVDLPPDRAYDRRWALTLLHEANVRLEREYAAAGKPEEFQVLKGHLTADRGAIPYEQIANALDTSEGAARVAVHRMRKRFREVFRAAVADTVANADEVEEEFLHVLGTLSHI